MNHDHPQNPTDVKSLRDLQSTMGMVFANVTEMLKSFPAEDEWKEGVARCAEQIAEQLESNNVLAPLSVADRARVTKALDHVMESLSSSQCRDAVRKLLESYVQLQQFMERVVSFGLLLEEFGNVTFSFDD